MTENKRVISILMADDDIDDCQMTKEALAESRLSNDFYVVHDGEELMDYLKGRGKYSGGDFSPRPGVILLDLNMPRKSGREALAEIKADPALRQIPVVVLTTSAAEGDIFRSYDLGASSFITKPVTFDRLVEVMRSLGSYWLQVVELPQQSEPARN